MIIIGSTDILIHNNKHCLIRMYSLAMLQCCKMRSSPYKGKMQHFSQKYGNVIVILLHCNIATLLHCNIATLQHCNIATLQHCNIATLQHCNIATLLHCCKYSNRELMQCNKHCKVPGRCKSFDVRLQLVAWC